MTIQQQFSWFRDVRFRPARFILDPRDAYAEAPGDRPRIRPRGAVRYKVLRPTGGNDYDSPIQLKVVDSLSGYGLFFGETTTEGRGRPGWPQRDVLQPGTYEVSARNELYEESLRTDVVVPVDEMAPPHVYRFDLISRVSAPRGTGRYTIRGVVRSLTGDVLGGWNVGAKVGTVEWSPAKPTEPDGQWVIHPQPPYGAERQRVTVEFLEPGAGQPEVVTVTVRPGIPRTVNQIAVFGSVQLLESGVDNAEVEADHATFGTLGPVATDVKGRWSLYFPVGFDGGTVGFTARLSDGTSSPRQLVPVDRSAAVKVPDFRF